MAVYLGGKSKKAKIIVNNMALFIPDFEQLIANQFIDGFSGTGAVSFELAQRYPNANILLNDNFLVSNLLSKAKLYQFSATDKQHEHLQIIIQRLNNTLSKAEKSDVWLDVQSKSEVGQFFIQQYVQNVPFFSLKQMCSTIFLREKIEQLRISRSISVHQYEVLLGLLCGALLNVANIRLSFDAVNNQTPKYERTVYLKSPLNQNGDMLKSQHQIQFAQSDIRELLTQSSGILYLDPPTTFKTYGKRYHFLSSLIEWTKGDVLNIKNGYIFRETEPKSDWCYLSLVASELRYVLLNHNAQYIVLTYAKSGLLSPQEITAILNATGLSSTLKTFDLGNEIGYIIKGHKS